MTSPASTPVPRKAAVAFIFVTVVLDVLAMGIVIPVLPRLILDFEGGDMANATIISGYFGVAWAIMQFMFQPVLGALSDRYGRRPVLLFSMAGLGLDYIVMALAPTLWWLFAGRLISGVCASSFGTANAYIADVTPPEKRGAAFGIIGAAFGLGFVLGPALGGLLGGIDPRLPFWVAAAVCLLNAMYGLFVLPESLPPEKRQKDKMPSFHPFGALTYFAKHPQLAGIGVAQFFYMVAHNVMPAVWVLNTAHRFGWSEAMTGVSLAVHGTFSIVVQGGLAGRAVKLLGEKRAMLTGLAFGATGMTMYGFAPSEVWIWIAMPVFALWGFYSPAMQSYVSQKIPPTEQGALQGALSGIMGFSSIMSPYLYTQVFAWFIGPNRPFALDGAPFVLAALLLMAAMATLTIAFRAIAPHPADASRS
jgi:DHA1 family tetracycline resistance protein-like MFS transporter